MNRKLVEDRLKYMEKETGGKVLIDPETVHLQVAICFVTIATLVSGNKNILWRMFRYSKKVSDVVRFKGGD